MKLEYQLTQEDYIEFNVHHMTTSKEYKRAIFIQRLLFLVLLVLLTLSVSRHSGMHWAFGAVLFGILYVFFIPYFPRRMKKLMANRVKKMLQRGDNSSFLGEQLLEINEAGIYKKSRASENSNSWDLVQKVEESHNLILIYVSSVSAYMVPKNLFENEEKKKEFIEMINKMRNENKKSEVDRNC